MKAFISIDMEGICGVVSEIETDPIKGGEAYQRNRHLMTQEANAAVEGCLKAGATEVLVADSHWNFDNLIPEELHEAAMLLRGTPRSFSMVQDLDSSYDAALFIGYHARAGTPRAILDHTYSGTIASVRVNDEEVGETGINAFLAGHHGVPVVLVTGDRAVTAEAKALIPRVHTVAVKDATGATAARNLHPKKAREEIQTEAAKAVRETKTREIIENVGEQNVARLELNKTLIEDFWKVWKRFNKINVHFALEPSYTNWGVFPDTFPDGDWHWRPGFNTAAVQSIQLLDRSMDQGRVGDALKVNYVETDGKAHLRVTFEYCEGEHYYKYSGWKRIWTIHTLYDEPLDKTNVDDLHRLFADLVRVWYESHLRRNRDVLIKYLKQTFEKMETFNQ